MDDLVLVADEPVVSLVAVDGELDDDLTLTFDKPTREGTYVVAGKTVEIVTYSSCRSCRSLNAMPQLRAEIDSRLFLGQSPEYVHATYVPEDMKPMFSRQSLRRHRDKGHIPPDVAVAIAIWQERIRQEMRQTVGRVVELDVQRKTILSMEMDRFTRWLEANPGSIADRKQVLQHMRLSQREDQRDYATMQRLVQDSRDAARAFAEMMVSVATDHRELGPIFRKHIDDDPRLRKYFDRLREEAAVEAAQPQASLSSSSVSE